MIESGEPGQVIITSSGDGGFAPVADRVGLRRVQGRGQLLHRGARSSTWCSEDAPLRASVFYPSGGLMDTGLYTAARNRPEHLQRTGEGTGRRS